MYQISNVPFLYVNYEISYENLLFKIDRFMGDSRLETLFIEIYNTPQSLNVISMRQITESKDVTELDGEKYKIKILSLPNYTQVFFSRKSRRVFPARDRNSQRTGA